MITNKEYQRLWEKFLEEYCYCYEDEDGNRSCDYGGLCFRCDELMDVWRVIIREATDISEK